MNSAYFNYTPAPRKRGRLTTKVSTPFLTSTDRCIESSLSCILAHVLPLGVLNLDKPPVMSSARAVGRVKRLLPRRCKVGHAGTLDPFATGVLLILVGKATRWSQALMSEPKQYLATVQFGATTATDDPTWPATPFTPLSGGPIIPPAMQDVNAAVEQFVGSILQLPPSFSALRVAGRRAYELARRGKDVPLQPRTVNVHAIEILSYEWPLLRLKIDCGRGTYIRSIARDLGTVLDVGGHLAELQRTRVGPFHIEAATSLDSLTPENLVSHLHPYGPLPKSHPSPADSGLDDEGEEDQQQD